jgi:hypothetical protein
MVLLLCEFAFEYLFDCFLVGKLHCFEKNDNPHYWEDYDNKYKTIDQLASLLMSKGLILNIMYAFLIARPKKCNM